jgi:hypothetical protein
MMRTYTGCDGENPELKPVVVERDVEVKPRKTPSDCFGCEKITCPFHPDTEVS